MFFKIPKRPKIVPKSIQTCFERVLGQTFRKFFAQFSTAFRILENFQKNRKKFQNSKKRPKSFPKESKRVLIVIWTIFSKNFCPVFHGKSSLRKFSKKNIFKIPKLPKSVPKSIQTCFKVIFSNKIYARCSMEGRVFEKFLKNQKILKIQKCPKSFPKVSKPVLNMFWGNFFENFLPSFPRRFES